MKTVLCLSFVLGVLAAEVLGADLTVPGDANIFGAGHAVPPNPGGGSAGTLPPVHQLNPGDSVLRFSVTGSNTLTLPFGFHGPDGMINRPSQVYSYQGISGIGGGSAGFLAGVFLGDDEPMDPSPPMLSFSGEDLALPGFAPRLGQTFFIGDGWTGSGSGEQQLFMVPAGATRLFLGFADAYDYNGAPGQYQDNGGELVVTPQSVVINSGSPPLIFSSLVRERTVFEGETAVLFNVDVRGAEPLTYQWLKEGTMPVGGNSSSLQLTSAQAQDAGSYVMVVTNQYGAATSAPVHLNVQSSSISFLYQPESVVNVRGASSTFFAFASSVAGPLRYQWQFNGIDLPFGTNRILTVTNAQPVNEGTYHVVAYHSYSAATSAPASLTLTNHGATWFANIQPIEIEDDDEAFPYPSSIEVSGLFGRITNLTVSLLGLEHRWPDDIDILLVGPSGQSVMLMSDAGGGFGFFALNLFFTKDAAFFLPDSGPISSGKARPTNFGEFDSLPFPAPPGPHGNDLSVFHDTDPNGTWSLYVRDDEEDGWGKITGGWRIDFQGDVVPPSPEPLALDHWHVRHSASGKILSGVAVHNRQFTAVGSAGTILHSSSGYEWASVPPTGPAGLADIAWGSGTWVAVGGSEILTSTDQLTWTVRTSTPPATLSDVAYGNNTFVAVGRTDAVRVSTDSGLTWRSVTLGNNLLLESVAHGAGLFVTVSRSGAILTSTDGVTWTPASSTNTLPLFSVTHANGTFVCGGDAGILLSSADGTIWRKHTFTWPDAPQITALAFDGDTFVAVCGTGTNLIYQSDPILPRAVGIGAAPRHTTVRLGGATNLSVAASGTSPFAYQWLRGAIPLVGATNRTLACSNAQISIEGHYAVIITNAFGSVTSAPVSLTVGVPPAVTVHPLSQEIVPGGMVTLSIAVSGTPPFIYRWRQPGSIFTILTSSNHQSFWTISNAQLANTGAYGVYVTNDFGFVVSRAAQLTLAADADGDGLPDRWEIEHGFNTNDLTDALLDSDSDGVTNLAEHRSGTNPTNAASVLRLGAAWTTNGVSLRFHAESNKTYSLQYAEPRPQFDWKPLIDLVARTNSRMESFEAPHPLENRLYRAVSPRQP